MFFALSIANPDFLLSQCIVNVNIYFMVYLNHELLIYWLKNHDLYVSYTEVNYYRTNLRHQWLTKTAKHYKLLQSDLVSVFILVPVFWKTIVILEKIVFKKGNYFYFIFYLSNFVKTVKGRPTKTLMDLILEC